MSTRYGIEIEALTNMTNSKISAHINNIVVAASVVLLIALAFEITLGERNHFSAYYCALEGVVCSTYLVKFFYDMSIARSRKLFFKRHSIILLLSLPYLSVATLLGLDLHRSMALTLGFLPIVRALISFYRLFMRLVSAQSIDKILVAYLMVTLLFSYIAALIFYDCEVGINPSLHGFGNAVWWALMGLTTVGASIFPVTTIGKILSVILPLLGMMLLPLFTSYIIALHKRRG